MSAAEAGQPANDARRGNGIDGADTPPRIITGAEFNRLWQPPDWLVDGIIQRGRLYACTSVAGHGKTAVFLYVSCMVMTGEYVGTMRTSRGKVVYLAGENPADFCDRTNAATSRYYVKRPGSVARPIGAAGLPYVFPRQVPLTASEINRLGDEIEDLDEEIALIVVDTAAAYFDGDDANSNVMQGDYARHLRHLTSCSGNPAVVVLSHPVKRAERTNLLPAGGGAFFNELDANLTLWSDNSGKQTTLHWQGKLRGGDFEPLTFNLERVTLPELCDTWGRPLKTVLAYPVSEDEAEQARSAAFSDENAVLRVLSTANGEAVSIRDIARQCGWMNERNEPNRSKVLRVLDKLREQRMARQDRDNGSWKITKLGSADVAGETA